MIKTEIEYAVRALAFSAFSSAAMMIWIPHGQENFVQLAILTLFLNFVAALCLLSWEGLTGGFSELLSLLEAYLKRRKDGGHK